jgi:UDP-N-acetylglucosamine:LPS N-acetylglucosamine transferase
VRRGEVRVPVVTFVIDPGAHPYWVSRAVALHLAALPVTAAHLASFGAGRIGLASPLLRPEFEHPPARADARRRLGLPPDAVIALLTAGSWAAGDLRGTLDTVRGFGSVLPVVLCGHDEQFRARVAALDGVLAVGWTADMAAYIAAADVVVDNAGGQTCWEALSCGVPVLMFRPLPGHGRINAETLDAEGLARWVHSPGELAAAIRDLRPAPASPLRFLGCDAADQVLAVAAGA